MRPGKLFELKDSVLFYEMHSVESRLLLPGTVFMVVSIETAKSFPHETLWKILTETKVGIIQINGVRMLDITPFKKELNNATSH